MSNQLPVNELKIGLDTRSPIQVETSAEILTTAAMSLREIPEISVFARIEIIEVRQGSWWAHLLVMAGSVGAMTIAAHGLADEIRAGKTPFSRALAAAVSEGQAEVCTITTHDESIEVPKSEMRALAGLIPGENVFGMGPHGRADAPSVHPVEDAQEKDFLGTEYGEIITDEQGNPLEVSPPIEPKASEDRAQGMWRFKTQPIQLVGKLRSDSSQMSFLDANEAVLAPTVILNGTMPAPPTDRLIRIFGRLPISTTQVLMVDRWEEVEG